jgi:hypothetical protein
MKNLILTIALVCGVFACQAQNTAGDWYVGTGDVDNVAWTEWSISPSIGYAITDDLMLGCSVLQSDSSADIDVDFHARYFWKGFFGYLGMNGLSTDGMSLGAGKMFIVRNNIYVDPKVVYNTGEGTTNLTLGFGLKF